MMTVPSLVICGVTSRRSEAEMNSTLISVAVVFTTGICVPCSMIAVWLFWVAIRGDDRIFTSPFSSKASSLAFRVKLFRTLPKLTPRLLAVALAGRLTS